LDISKHLQELEAQLLSDTTRKDAARVASLLADGFREFGSSGRVYSKDDTIAMLQDEAPLRLSLSDFGLTLLAPGVALVTYRSVRDGSDALPTVALRSSIWIQHGEDWRMIFHQGTKLASAAESARPHESSETPTAPEIHRDV
jgi:hypothetical protein